MIKWDGLDVEMHKLTNGRHFTQVHDMRTGFSYRPSYVKDLPDLVESIQIHAWIHSFWSNADQEWLPCRGGPTRFYCTTGTGLAWGASLRSRA